MYVKTRSPIWLVGPLADRPLATDFRGTYTAEDEDDGTTYRSDGATWAQVGAGVSATGGGPVAAEDVSVDSTTLVGVGTDVQAVLEELDNAVAAAAPIGAKYIVQTADATLSAEQALGALATGIVKNTTTTGVLSIAAPGTDYYNPGGTDVAVADGGTGASTAAAARTNLGVPAADPSYLFLTRYVCKR